jgi:hypothetical protein
VLDRCVFRHRKQNVIVVSDAHDGGHIREAVIDFLPAAAGGNAETLALNLNSGNVSAVLSIWWLMSATMPSSVARRLYFQHIVRIR